MATGKLSDTPPDSGWITATLSSDFVAYSTSAENATKYRKIGKLVCIQGTVKPTSEIASGSSATIFTLPSGFRPQVDIHELCQGSLANKWKVAVWTGGAVQLARYGTTSYAACPTTHWLPFSIQFLVN